MFIVQPSKGSKSLGLSSVVNLVQKLHSKKTFPEPQLYPRILTKNESPIGLSRASADEFLNLFEYGIPRSKLDGKDVMIIYLNDKSLRIDLERPKDISYDCNGVPMISAANATANCDTLNIITIQRGKNKLNALRLSTNLKATFRSGRDHTTSLSNLWNQWVEGCKIMGGTVPRSIPSILQGS